MRAYGLIAVIAVVVSSGTVAALTVTAIAATALTIAALTTGTALGADVVFGNKPLDLDQCLAAGKVQSALLINAPSRWARTRSGTAATQRAVRTGNCRCRSHLPYPRGRALS